VRRSTITESFYFYVLELYEMPIRSKNNVPVSTKMMEKFQNKYYNSIWIWPTFSIGVHGDCFVCDSKGRTKNKIPVDVDEFPFMNEVIKLAVLIRPEGGRFHVKDDHVIYAIRRRICEIELY